MTTDSRSATSNLIEALVESGMTKEEAIAEVEAIVRLAKRMTE